MPSRKQSAASASVTPGPAPRALRKAGASLAGEHLVNGHAVDEFDDDESPDPYARSSRATACSEAELACMPLIAELKARCCSFGIDATRGEILRAALLVLGRHTDTALEVEMLQSLRADRTFFSRRARHR